MFGNRSQDSGSLLNNSVLSMHSVQKMGRMKVRLEKSKKAAGKMVSRNVAGLFRRVLFSCLSF